MALSGSGIEKAFHNELDSFKFKMPGNQTIAFSANEVLLDWAQKQYPRWKEKNKVSSAPVARIPKVFLDDSQLENDLQKKFKGPSFLLPQVHLVWVLVTITRKLNTRKLNTRILNTENSTQENSTHFKPSIIVIYIIHVYSLLVLLIIYAFDTIFLECLCLRLDFFYRFLSWF